MRAAICLVDYVFSPQTIQWRNEIPSNTVGRLATGRLRKPK